MQSSNTHSQQSTIHSESDTKILLLSSNVGNRALIEYLKNTLKARGVRASSIDINGLMFRNLREYTAASNVLVKRVADEISNSKTIVFADISRYIFDVCYDKVIGGENAFYENILTTFGHKNVCIYSTRRDETRENLTENLIKITRIDTTSRQILESNHGTEKNLQVIKQQTYTEFEHICNALEQRGVKFKFYGSNSNWAQYILDTYTGSTNELFDDEAGDLRLYVPKDKYQSDQIETFIRLFENYLNHIEHCEVRVNSIRSGEGTLFVFKMPENAASNTMPSFTVAATQFEAFMTLCNHDPLEAQRIVYGLGLPSEQTSYLVSKFGKQFQRLLLDTRQALEAKQQSLRHSLESEVMELQMNSKPTDGFGLHQATLGHMLLPALGTYPMNSSTKNIRPSDKVFVPPIDVSTYTPAEQDVLQAIQENASTENDQISLTSDLNQLKDETADTKVRRSAWNRLYNWGQRNATAAFTIFCKAGFEYYGDKLGGGG